MINGRSITQSEFDMRWEELSQATRARYEKEGGKRRFLDELIMRELLMQEARKQGLDQADEIREKTRQFKEQLILDELLKDRIKTKVEVSKEELDTLPREPREPTPGQSEGAGIGHVAPERLRGEGP